MIVFISKPKSCLKKRVSKFHYLGALFDENLTLEGHVEEISIKASKRLGLMARICSCLTIASTKCIFSTLVKPVLDYTDAAWGELSEGCKMIYSVSRIEVHE